METTRVITKANSQYRILVYLDSRVPKSDQLIICETLRVELMDGRIAKVPNRMLSDCHSTPRWLDFLMPHFDAKTNLAAIVHDYLYMNWEDFEQQTGPLLMVWDLEPIDSAACQQRQYCDGCYLELMERFRPGNWRNTLYYTAVRLFGGWNWRKFRRANSPV